jgi:hypothetical protein
MLLRAPHHPSDPASTVAQTFGAPATTSLPACKAAVWRH